MSDIQLFSEVFPLRGSAVPSLSCFELDCPPQLKASIGGRLSYRLRRAIGGRWASTVDGLLTGGDATDEQVMDVVKELWETQRDRSRELRGINKKAEYEPTPQATAEFAARALTGDADKEIRRTLASEVVDLGNALIERMHEIKPWVVNDGPALSVSIHSRLRHKQDLSSLAARLPKTELKGLWVFDKISSLKGTVEDVIGTVKSHRERLRALTSRNDMAKIVECADENEPVVTVVVGRTSYDYVASALGVIVRTADFGRFGVDAAKAQRSLTIAPEARTRLLTPVVQVLKDKALIDEACSSTRTPALFLDGSTAGFSPRLRFGDGKSCTYEEKNLMGLLRQHGLFRNNERLEAGNPLHIGVLAATPSAVEGRMWNAIVSELEKLGVKCVKSGPVRVKNQDRSALEHAVAQLEQEDPDVLLALLPDEGDEDTSEWTSYHDFKSVTIGRDLPGQVVNESTIGNRFATANIALGLLGKTGNIPYVLAEPLEYADMVVGIDIARQRKERLAGSMNATAITRIYFGDGEFLRYVIHDAPLEGETIPDHVLHALFPSDEFTGKRVVIHRDGYFRGGEVRALVGWAKELGSLFSLVEVIKTGTPRIYARSSRKTIQPPKGSVFRLGDDEAFVVSTLPPFPTATPQPLHIRTKGGFPIEQAIHSVLSLTLLHYGSTRPPRLPVTIHYSDRIAYLALRGIKPKSLEGKLPFWL